MFHPSCLGNDAPYDSEQWACFQCQANNDTEHGDPKCPVCAVDVGDDEQGLLCERCMVWFHCDCAGVSSEDYEQFVHCDEDWFCIGCKVIRANNLKWGNMEGEEEIQMALNKIYGEVICWKRNLFLLPRGKAAIDFIKEMTRIIYLFVNNTKYKRLSLKLLHVFIPIMLQKPSLKSKAKKNAEYLGKRLLLWKDGDLDSIMSEAREIQSRLKAFNKVQEEAKSKGFCRLMFQGKVRQAMKLVDNDNDVKGVHRLT